MANSTDVTAGTNIRASEFNNLRKDVVLGLAVAGTETDGATVTIDLSDKTKGKIRSVTLGGNRTLALSNETVGQTFGLRIIQDGTGSRTITWWSGIKWDSGVTPVLSTTPAAIDVFVFFVVSAGVYDGYRVGSALA